VSTEHEAWLEQRKRYLTASDVAAVLGENPYCTREQVIAEKCGLARDEPDHDARVRMALGTHLEDGIAETAREVFGWDLQKHGQLTADLVEPRLAATPDYFMATPWGHVNIQVKMTRAYHRGKSGWGVKGPPLHYQIQVQAEMACTMTSHSVLLVCHAGELSLRSYYVPRHEATIARIRAEVAKAWKEIEAWKAK
jgi:putative phage-type endonuclease